MPRRFTHRQFLAYLDAEGRRLHTDRQERWEHVRLLVASHGGKLDEYPDYASPEEGPEDLDANEAALERDPMVIHAAPPES